MTNEKFDSDPIFGPYFKNYGPSEIRQLVHKRTQENNRLIITDAQAHELLNALDAMYLLSEHGCLTTCGRGCILDRNLMFPESMDCHFYQARAALANVRRQIPSNEVEKQEVEE